MSDALPKFVQGMFAAAHLLNEAMKHRRALECIVLQANIMDGMLRMALILKRQIETKSRVIDEKLIRQLDSDGPISERSIYKLCLEAGIIQQDLFADLSVAYDKRNKCIHRYLLSDINYDYATNLVFELDALSDKVIAVVKGLEAEQVRLGVGMTVAGPELSKEFLREYAEQKEKSHHLGS